MDKVHLVVSIPTLGSGGAERVLSILAPYFADRYNRVTIVLWEKAPQFYAIDKRVELITIPNECHKDRLLNKLLWFRKYVKRSNPNVVLSFLYPYSLRVILSLAGLKTAVIAAERRDPRIVRGGRPIRVIRDFMYKGVTRVFVQSNFNKRLYPSFLQKKIDVLYNPICLPSSLIQSYDISKERRKEIVTVGRLIPIKNHKLLIDAFSFFKLSHPHYRLIIWGDGPLKYELGEYVSAKGLKLGIDVIMPGSCKDVLEKIENATCFVLSSKSEGMPNALYEAICMGIPSISTRITGVMDLLENGKNVLLVDDDAKQLARTMSYLLEDVNLRNKLSYEGRKLYATLNPQSIASTWINAIENVIR